MRYGEHVRELSGGERDTTNNRMELTAVIEGLQALKESCDVTVYSDSKYVVDALSKGWAKRWKANNWMRTKNEPALNTDLWESCLPCWKSMPSPLSGSKATPAIPKTSAATASRWSSHKKLTEY